MTKKNIPDSRRFESYQLINGGKSFRIVTGETFDFDKYGGWLKLYLLLGMMKMIIILIKMEFGFLHPMMRDQLTAYMINMMVF
jgi:hypothetical protein